MMKLRHHLLILAGLIGMVAQGQEAAAQQLPTARGVVSPRIEATLSAQIGGRITRLPVDRGQSVRQGDVVAEFDCTLEHARTKAAVADLDGARARLVNLQRLDRMGSAGKVEVQIAAAEADKAAALLEERRGILRYCTVTAPFDAVVVDTPVHANESVEVGKPLVSLVDNRTLRVVVLAPSNWAGWLKVGLPVTFTVDETGESFAAAVTQLDGRIDPGSQTITVFVEPKKGGTTPHLISGMTGSAVFDVPQVSAAPVKR